MGETEGNSAGERDGYFSETQGGGKMRKDVGMGF
jgi:hypothetical protein